MKVFALVLGMLLALCGLPAVAQLQPQNPLLSGLSSLNAGRYAQALSEFALAARQRPNDVQARYCLGVTYHYLGRLQEAMREYQWVVKNARDPALIRRANKGIAGCAGDVSPTGHTYSENAPPASGAAEGTVGASGFAGAAQRAASPMLSEPVISQAQPPAFGGGGRIVDIYTDWCGWCKRFEPVFEEARSKYGGRIAFERVNAEAPENVEMVKQWDVHGFPSTLFFDSNGNIVHRIRGFVKLDAFEQQIQQVFPQ